MASFCEQGNEPSVLIDGGEILGCLVLLLCAVEMVRECMSAVTHITYQTRYTPSTCFTFFYFTPFPFNAPRQFTRLLNLYSLIFAFNGLLLAALWYAHPFCLMGILFLIYAHPFKNASRT